MSIGPNVSVDELRAFLAREDNPFKHVAMGHPNTVDHQIGLAVRNNFYPFAIFFVTPHVPDGKQHLEEVPFYIDWCCYDENLAPYDKHEFAAQRFHKK